MSRSKVGYDFTPTPRKWHHGWAGASMQMRGIRSSLFELNNGGPVAIDGEWLDSLCRQMAVPGRDRPNARKSLLQLQKSGLLRVDGGFVSVTFHPAPVDVPSTSDRRPLDVPSTSPHSPVDVPFDSTPRNDTTHVRQTDKKEETRERETRAHARESSARFERPPVGEAPPNTPRSEPAPIRPEARCWQLYQRALGTEHLLLPPNHHDALQALASAAKAEADGATHGEAFDRAAQRILGVWMAEKYWQEKRPGLRNLKERLEAGKYAAARQKPLLKVVDPSTLSDEELAARLDALTAANRARLASGGAS